MIIMTHITYTSHPRVLVNDISEPDAHALCLALHKHLGVPI